jgi:hypothetical protein
MPASMGSPDRATSSLFAPSLAALFSMGCGGAAPLLHPAHTLAPGTVTFGGGASGTFVAGRAQARLEDARAVAASGAASTDAERRTLTEGAAVSVLATPGLAPWVGARVGIAERTEAGAAYTGQWARVDVRHALEDRKLALSFGIAGLALLAHPTADPNEPVGTSGAIAGVDSGGVYGFGVNIPVLVGYRSDAELVQAWGGLIGTFEHAFGKVVLPDAQYWPAASDAAEAGAIEVHMDANRFSGAGVLGIAVGLQPIWVAVEITGRYFSLDGKLSRAGTRADGELDGFSVEPAGAILGRF